MKPNEKPFEFHGGAGEYFLKSLGSALLMYVIIIGWPIAFNLMTGYVVNNLTIKGRKLKYEADYGEVLGFLLLNILLIIITFGIWSFWFVPRAYRFICDHTTIAEAVVASQPVAQPASPPASPAPVVP